MGTILAVEHAMVRRIGYLGGFAFAMTALPALADSAWTPHVSHFLVPEQAAVPVSPALTGWDARIEYGVATDAVDAPRTFASGDPTETVFIVIQRSFPGRDVTPYIGLGAGYAESLVEARSSVLGDALAFKGVFGAGIALESNLDVFVEYNFAVAPGALAGDGQSRSLRSHAISTGLRLNLN